MIANLARPLLPLFASACLLHADEEAFDAAPDASWTRFDPTYKANFDFSGFSARLACGLMTEAEMTPIYLQYGESVIFPRAVVFAPSEFGDACVSVDLLDWTPTTNRSVNGQYHALFTRIQPGIGLASVNGYGMAIMDLGNGTAELELDIISNEAPIEIESRLSFPFVSGKDYRLVLSSRGNVHTARVFDLAAPAAPVAELQTIDDTYTTGRSGFGVLTDRFVTVDATFDNFLTWDGSLPPVVIEPGIDPGTIVLVSDLRRAMGSRLETTTDLAAQWQPAAPNAVETAGGQLRLVFTKDQPRRFFRRKSL